MDYANMFSLQGRRAVVVGTGGIGAEVVAGLAAHGADVVCVDRDEATASAAVERADAERAGTHEPRVLDVLDAAAVEALVADLGAVDVLVVTAALNVRKALLDYTPEEFDRVVDLNLRASFTLTTAFGRAMAERGSGSIIAFSSIRALAVEPGQGIYAATKAGLVQMLRTLAAELGPRGVRVNAVAPGVVATPLTAQIRADEAWDRAYAGKSALDRWARPEEMVGAVVYLASDAASFVTGSQLLVDGGWTAIDGRFTPPLP